MDYPAVLLASSLLLCLLVSSLFSSLHYYKKKKKKKSGSRALPPGSSGWPVIGETVEYVSTRRQGQPEKFVFERAAKYSSTIFRTHLLGYNMAVLSGAAGNKFLFSNENKLVRAWWPTCFLKILQPNQESTRLRKMTPNFLKPDALHGYVGVMDRAAQRHVAEEWDNKEQVVVFPLVKHYAVAVGCQIFLSIDDRQMVLKWAQPFDTMSCGVFSIPIDLPGTAFNDAIKASNLIRKELLSSIIAQRKMDLAEGKASETQDILSHMILYRDENGDHMTDREIVDKILALIFASHDPSSSVCASIVMYLAELPQIYDTVYQEQMEIAKSKAPGELLNWEDLKEMKYTWNVACEVMRLAPPLQGSFREAIADFEYNGFSIPKGWKLYWSANSTHQNPEYHVEPEKFDPSRFQGSGPAPYTFVPFGGGPKMCPGNEYARLEILVLVHHLVKRFRWEKIIPDEKIVLDPVPKPAMGLPVRLFPHKP